MVEWKKLGEVANLVRGKVISKDFIRDNAGIYPVYSSQTANDGVLGYIDSYMFDGDFLTWTTDGAYAGTIFRRKGRFNITNVCGLIDIKDQRLLQDYLYYWLSLIAKSYVQEGMGNPKLMSNVASIILIPIPSLSEQQRIVSILDTFTSSISNLKQQIEERRKQYEYERDLLLDLEGKEGVEMKKLGDFAEIGTGSSNTQDELESGRYPFFVRSQIVKWKDDYEFDEIAIITSGDGVGVGKVLHYYEGKYALHQRAYRIHVENDSIVPKFIFYFMQKDFYWYIMSNAYAASVTSVRRPMLINYPIPIPPLSTQSRIVSILDTFEQSISNLEEQLAMREKQYEYYRNQLLTFEGEEERGKT